MAGSVRPDDVASDKARHTTAPRLGQRGSLGLRGLTPIIYDDLIRLARAKLNREPRDCTLQPTALVHESYLRLTDLDERKSRAIQLKFFGGLTAEEIGRVLGVSVGTVGRELRLGQAWLRRELSRQSA